MNAAIVDAPIELDALAERVRTDACGAVVAFLGVVRETSPGDDRRVEAILYEAYPAMALPEMEAIAAETRARFGPLEITIVHRVGELKLGEASIGVAVGAPHRGPAFDACEYAMDEIKARVAVWKQERYRGGGNAWRANTASPLP